MARRPPPPPPPPGRCRGDEGTAIVELAFALPLLLMLVFGVYEVSRGYHTKAALTGAVREGARAVALRQTSPDPVQVVRDASLGLSPAPSVTVVHACPATPAAGENAVVRARYDLRHSIPFVSEGVWTITAEGVMRCGL